MPRSNSPSAENAGTPGTATPRESQTDAARWKGAAARREPGKRRCCSGGFSVPMKPRGQQNPFHYRANEPTPSMLHPTAHPSTGQIPLSRGGRAEGLSSMPHSRGSCNLCSLVSRAHRQTLRSGVDFLCSSYLFSPIFYCKQP